jgi:hypothetical protein
VDAQRAVEISVSPASSRRDGRARKEASHVATSWNRKGQRRSGRASARPTTEARSHEDEGSITRKEGIMKTSMLTRVLVAGALLLCASAAFAVDASMFTITCNTFLKGSGKFKPALTPTACATGVSEVISIKGTVSDCTVGGAPATFKIASGSVKGTITTNDCTCSGIGIGLHPITAGALTVTWKTASGSDPIDNKTSLIALSAAAKIDANVLIPGGNFTGIYGTFALHGSGIGVTGSFQGSDSGTMSSLAGVTSESATLLLANCNGSGLKGFTFGFADAVLK